MLVVTAPTTSGGDTQRHHDSAACLVSVYSVAAQDLQKDGCSLAVILKAGQWRSAAFVRYIDEAELQKVVSRACLHGCIFGPCIPGRHFGIVDRFR